MKSPYEILGVSSNATEDQIKDAYRELARKYHPDKYINNPLAGLAAEKMQEINWAYDELMKNRGSYSSNGQQNQFANFNQVRSLINENRLEYKCAECGNRGEWLGKPLSLQLDHINGKNNDHRIENLRFLCPNCHTQTDTYSGKNK